jgi:hypothetical protein
MDTLSKPQVRTRRRRPSRIVPKNKKAETNLTEVDRRRLNVLLELDSTSDAELLRAYILDLLDRRGIVDPGPAAEEAMALAS